MGTSMWFNETPDQAATLRLSTRGRYHNTGGIDTSAIDARRQGVEITLPNHRALGLAKIGTGELGGFVQQDTFGNDGSGGATVFVDGDAGGASSGPSNFDGIMEVLAIRDAAVNDYSQHTVRGTLMAGSEDIDGRAAMFVSSFTRDLQTRAKGAFRDSTDALGNIPFVQMFADAVILIKPVNDVTTKSGVRVPSTADSDIVTALLAMSPATDAGIVAVEMTSPTSGFTYDSQQAVGTDSLAFGGMER